MIWLVAGREYEGKIWTSESGPYPFLAKKPCCSFGSKQAERLSILHSHRGVHRVVAVQLRSSVFELLPFVNWRGFLRIEHPCCRRRPSLVSDCVYGWRSWWVMGSGCSEGCDERDCDLWKTKESLHHCCLNGGRVRLPMCLIRRGVVTRDHTFRERGVEVKYSRAGSHEAGRLQTRLVDMDFAANPSHSCGDRVGGVPVPCLKGDYQMNRDW